MTGKPTWFEKPADFRRWLKANHEKAPELLVGFWKKGSGKPSIDWPEARDEALCVGWIDGVRRSLGAESYTIRFTPRRKGSIWSRINIARYEALTAEGRMHEAGVRAYEENRHKTGIYAYENQQKDLEPAETAAFSANQAAWAWFEASAPSYRKVALHWINSAKKPETRARRLAALIEDSAAGRKVGVVEIKRKKED